MRNFFFRKCLVICVAALPAFGGDLVGKIEAGPVPPEGSPSKDAPSPPAVAWLEGVPEKPSFSTRTLTISQRGAQFDPQFLVAVVGETLAMPNDDNIAHNVFSYSEAKQFNLGVYPKGESKSVVLDKPGKLDMFCSIHRHMHATVIIVPTSWYAEPDAEGNFAVREIPAGSYTLKIWREGSKDFAKEISIPAEGEAHEAIKLEPAAE